MKLFFASSGARYARLDAAPLGLPREENHRENVLKTGEYPVKETLDAIAKMAQVIKNAG